MKWRMFLVTCLVVLVTAGYAHAAQTPEEILAGLTTQEKITQLLIPAYRIASGGTTADVTTLSDEAAAVISSHPFAGIILYGENLQDNDVATLLIHQLQTANVSDDERPQLLIMTDQEGGLVTRLAHGTSGISPMALGAANNPAHTQTIARIMGEEVKALGINANCAPVADIPLDAHTDTIGLRAFGDSAELVSTHVQAYLKGLREAGVLNCLKHFPGMGAASDNTDDVDIPVTINRTRAEMDACELLPYRQALAAGLVDMIMVGHSSYPGLESRTFTASDGNTYTLPASMSPAIVTDLLREELGFDGLVVADALLGTMITSNFQPAQAIQRMLEAGIDVLPYSVELNSSTSIAALQTALTAFAAQVDANPTWREKLDAAVLRVLTFKSRHGLLTPYERTDSEAQAQAQQVLQTVSNQANHDTQWSVALDAVTLVDHVGELLPLSPDVTVAFAYYYASQLRSVQYGLDKLVSTGQMTQEQADAVRILDIHAEDLEDQLADVEVFVVLSSVYFEAEMSPESPSPYSDEIVIVLPLLEKLQAQGVKIIVASCHLPYDMGLYDSQADAILAGYLANGMPVAITTAANQPRFGVMVPALVYKLYDRLDDFHGHLPANVPVVADGAFQTDQILWPRGWGLTLAVRDEPIDDEPTDDDSEDNSSHNIRSSGGGCDVSGSGWLLLLIIGAGTLLHPGKKH